MFPIFDGKKQADVTPDQLAKIVKQRQEQTVERTPGLSEFPGATSPLHWFENYRAANSRAWLVTDDTDGKVPPPTEEANARNSARARARSAHGPVASDKQGGFSPLHSACRVPLRWLSVARVER